MPLRTKTVVKKNVSTLTAPQIYLEKRRRVLVADSTNAVSDTTKAMVLALNTNLEALGFILSRRLAERLMTFPVDRIAGFYESALPMLKKMVGAHRNFKPFYPNFPQQVVDASDLELYWNAVNHYWSFVVADVMDDQGFIWIPDYKKNPREALTEKVKLRVIDLGTAEDFRSIFTQLAGSNASISESDKEILAWFVENTTDLQSILPESIPQKENLAYLIGQALAHNKGDLLISRLKTATDVLRVASAMSGGDVSLAAPTKFRRFKRTERRFLLQCLEGSGSSMQEDMLRHAEKWKRLGRELRPGDYSKAYPKSFATFQAIRNDEPIITFNSQVELCMKIGQPDTALLRQRPGVFARRLDHALRIDKKPGKIVDAFLAVAKDVSTPVLLQTYNHFKNRAFGERTFFPKGNVAKVQIIEDTRPVLYPKVTEPLVEGIRATLVNRFANLPPLGSCYIDPLLQKAFVPFAQRSAAKALRTVTRGTRLPMPESPTIRFFLWWKNGDDRVDIDLSGAMYGPNWDLISHISFYRLRDEEMFCHHSGDITSAPNGACEFIDLSVEHLLKMGVQYAVMTINAYSGQSYCDLPECFAGWMGRQKPKSGEIFEAKTVVDKIDLASDSKMVVPVILDVKNREVIWTDMSVSTRRHMSNTLHGNLDGTGYTCRAVANLNKPNLYDLFSMHVEARGTLVDSPETADKVYSLHSGVTPYDYSLIASEYMA